MGNTLKNKHAISLAVVLLALAVALSLLGANLLGAFNHYEEPSLTEKKADLISMLSDDKFDNDLFLANITEEDLSVLGEYVRPVTVSAVRNYTKSEVVEILKQQYPDDINSFEDVPQRIKDGFNAEGVFPAVIANNQVNGFLVNNQVVVPLAAFTQVLQSNADDADKIHVEIKVRANPEVEDDWKEEVLFSGSAGDFVTDSGVKFEADHSLAFLLRPDTQVLVESNEYPYAEAQIKEVSSSNAVVYGNNARTAKAEVSHVIQDRGLIVINGAFSQQDFGLPVFVLKDGKPVWAGVIVSVVDSHTAVVVSTEALRAKALQR